MSGICDGLELEDEDLHHSHEDIAAGRLLLGFLSDTLDQVEEWLAGHGLDGDGQGGVVDVPGEQVHGQREVGEGGVCGYGGRGWHECCTPGTWRDRTIRNEREEERKRERRKEVHGRPCCLPGGPAGANKQVLIKKLIDARDKPAPQIGGQDVPGGDEQLAAKMSNLLRTVLEEGEHALHHVVGIRVHLVLWGARTMMGVRTGT